MEYTLDRFAREIEEAIAGTGLVPAEQVALDAPKGNIPADLALPCFRAAKERGSAPPALAAELQRALHFGPASLVGSAQATPQQVSGARSFELDRVQPVAVRQ